ncbi:MAG: anthranilate synthase component I family protein [Bacteroidia bacterium]|nr:anthranilate synthase component I family protein [Bacteroidia bacterium]
MRSKTYQINNPPEFKDKILHWANQFDTVCFLNNNNFNSNLNTYKALVGIGKVSELKLESTKGAFDSLKKYCQNNSQWLFGFLSYDLKNDVENLQTNNEDQVAMPELHFFSPEVVLELKHEGLTIHSHHEESDKIFDAICNYNSLPIENFDQNLSIKQRISKQDYCNKVKHIKDHIAKGDIYELNFCQEFYSEQATIDPLKTYTDLNRLSPMPFSSYYKLDDKYLICASPERFIKKTGTRLISQPIKGTISRGKTDDEEQIKKEFLRTSAKEKAENVMIVDLVRNDLSRSSKKGSVKVDELYGIYTFNQLHQMISTVSSELKDDVHFVDAIKRAFPMGSMTGAPKIRAMELIEKYEETKRGLFSGAVGYISPDKDLDFNVVIRSILYNQSTKYLSYQVGSAITANSEIESEYEECLLKAEAINKVLNKL